MTTPTPARALPSPDTIALLGAGSDAGRLLPGVARQMGFPVRSFIALGRAEDVPEDDPEADFEVEAKPLDDFDFGRVRLVLDLGPAPHAARAAALAAGARVIGRVADAGVAVGKSAPRGSRVPASRLALAELGLLPPGPHWHVPPPFAALVAPLVRALAGDGRLVQLALTALYPAAAYGQAGVEELAAQTASLLNAREPTPGVLPGRLAFNALLGTRHEDDVALAAALLDLLPDALDPAGLAVNGAVVPLFHGHLLSLVARIPEPGAAGALADRLAAATGTLRGGGFRRLETAPATSGRSRRGRRPEPTFSVADVALDDLRPMLGGWRETPGDERGPGTIAGWLAADGLTAGVVAPMLRLARRALDGG